MFTATAAIIAGETVTAGMALAAVAEVGMAVTVVGAATGNEDMMKVGGVMGLVGGVGSLAAGAMSSAGAAGAEAAGAAAASDAAVASGGGYMGAEAAASGYGLGDAAVTASGAWAGSEAAAASAFDWGSAASGFQEAGSIDWSAGVAADVDQAIQQGGMVGNEMATNGGGMIQTSADPSTLMSNGQNAVSSAPFEDGFRGSEVRPGAPDPSQAGQAGADMGGKQATDGFWGQMKKVGEWAEKNKTLAGILTNVGSNAVLGALKASNASDAEQQMLDLRRRQVALEEQKFANQSRTTAPSMTPRVAPHPIIAGARA